MQEGNELEERKKALRAAGTVNLSGKDYLQVAYRVRIMRLEHPEWSILTHFETIGENTVARCSVLDRDRVLAQSSKTVTPGGRGPAAKYPLEMAETGAIGRALALCGYGTLSGDLDEGEQIADSPVKKEW